MRDFILDELLLISDALLSAIASNGEASKLTTSRRAVDVITAHTRRLSALNKKICDMMTDDGVARQ